METKSLHEILREQLVIKGLDTEKLARLTNIPERYLVGLVSGDSEKLPPAPYIRGYLLKIAGYLDYDGETLWHLFKNERLVKTSGASDILPSNRFAIKKVSKKTVAGIVLAILLITYVVWNADRLLGRPDLQITSPESATTVVNQPDITIAGRINPNDKLLINGQEILVDANGDWQLTLELSAGLNRIEFLVKKFLGRETQAVRQVIYQQ